LLQKLKKAVQFLNGLIKEVLKSLSGGPSKISMPFIIKYIRKKVNGEPEKRETTAHTYIYLSFCPFCGEKYN